MFNVSFCCASHTYSLESSRVEQSIRLEKGRGIEEDVGKRDNFTERGCVYDVVHSLNLELGAMVRVL